MADSKVFKVFNHDRSEGRAIAACKFEELQVKGNLCNLMFISIHLRHDLIDYDRNSHLSTELCICEMMGHNRHHRPGVCSRSQCLAQRLRPRFLVLLNRPLCSPWNVRHVYISVIINFVRKVNQLKQKQTFEIL